MLLVLFIVVTVIFFLFRYLGHCVSYAVVASVLLGAAVSRHLSATNPLAARRDALQSTVIRLREGFRRKEQNSSSSSSEGCGSSMKRSSSVEAGHLGNVIEASSRSMAQCTVDGGNWNNVVLCRTASSQEGINSDKSIDSGRPSLALRSSSCRSVVQEPEVGTLFADKNVDHTSSLVVCSSSGLESQGCESSASASVNQQTLDFNLALAFQERLNDPRIASMLKRRAREGDVELTSLLQDKGLDPNFAMMLKEKNLDPTILALLQRSSLDADRDHRDNTDITIIDSNSVDNAMPNQISLSEELRLHGLDKWLQLSRLVLHHVVGTPERAWLLFSSVFILETVIVAIFRPKTIIIINATHQQVARSLFPWANVHFIWWHRDWFINSSGLIVGTKWIYIISRLFVVTWFYSYVSLTYLVNRYVCSLNSASQCYCCLWLSVQSWLSCVHFKQKKWP